MCITGHWFNVTGDKMFYRGEKDSWLVSAQSSKEENSEGFARQHAADSTSFYIFDEASGVPDKIFEVAEGGLTDGEPMIFLFGNATRTSGKFDRVMFGEERDRWIRRTVDSRTAKFTNKEQIKQWELDYGSDSDFFRVRVRGERPRAGTNQLIPHDIVAAARKFKATGYENLPKILAVDVARFGDDKTVLGIRQGRSSASTPNSATLTRSKRRTESLHASKQKSPMVSLLTEMGSAPVSWTSSGTAAMVTTRSIKPVFMSSTVDRGPLMSINTSTGEQKSGA